MILLTKRGVTCNLELLLLPLDAFLNTRLRPIKSEVELYFNLWIVIKMGYNKGFFKLAIKFFHLVKTEV